MVEIFWGGFKPENQKINTVVIEKDIMVSGDVYISPKTVESKETIESKETVAIEQKSGITQMGSNYVYTSYSPEEFADFFVELDIETYEIIDTIIPKESDEKAIIIYRKIRTNQNARS